MEERGNTYTQRVQKRTARKSIFGHPDDLADLLLGRSLEFLC